MFVSSHLTSKTLCVASSWELVSVLRYFISIGILSVLELLVTLVGVVIAVAYVISQVNRRSR